MRGRLIFILTLHVGKTRMCHRGAWKAGLEFPDVTRPELNLRRMAIFFLTLHVRKTGSGETGKGSGKTGLGSATEGTGKWDLKAKQEGGAGRRMAKQCALRERCEILCIFAALKY